MQLILAPIDHHSTKVFLCYIAALHESPLSIQNSDPQQWHQLDKPPDINHNKYILSCQYHNE
ncbi:unnamed protein product [Brugia timori]|uniref:Uncharacterized protein n=1 Tax=Brugia timori TaxID=42155 RepID=A0A3P7VLD2_9BILA|nr:unnamed protein product [Brugia timori]